MNYSKTSLMLSRQTSLNRLFCSSAIHWCLR